MKPVMANLTHAQRVRFLYKLILRTHRALPPELRELGDKYVRDEFKRHKNCEPSYVGPFMMEWTRYVMDLNKQIRSSTKVDSEEEPDDTPPIGNYLGEEDLDKFNDSQLSQLLELAEEIHGKKPDGLKKE
ncbi:unnamed protein product [Hymenolepis diminuta]|uniref:Succinate dehydrogenase assembly factor 3 n=1 Tax=Hymenolepis diminuta TaxID=6216 RepID=A0A564ZA57_HYMDI|nr:unnamed protein product [Hymenolepis diminuta]